MLEEGFGGVYPAVVSPRDSQGGFSVPAFERLIDRLYACGVHGLYVCGNTGEGYLMSAEERKLAAESAVRASDGRGKVVVHVGAPAERDAVDLAAHAAKVGADAISSLPPYVQRYRFQDIRDYYAHLSDAAGIPLFVYYIPVVTHREFSLDEVDALLGIDGVAGLKFTNHNLYLMEGILNGPRKPHIFNGHDEVFLAGLVMGAQGGIGTYYNVLPGHFVGIREAVARCDLDTGRRLQGEVNRVIRVVLGWGGHAGTREVLRMQGLECGDPMLPSRPFTAEERRRFQDDIEATQVDLAMA